MCKVEGHLNMDFKLNSQVLYIFAKWEVKKGQFKNLNQIKTRKLILDLMLRGFIQVLYVFYRKVKIEGQI